MSANYSTTKLEVLHIEIGFFRLAGSRASATGDLAASAVPGR